jgi:hypothetical protein
MLVQKILLEDSELGHRNAQNGVEKHLAEEMIRYSRLCFVLTFKACQDNGEADQFVTLLKQNLLNEQERQWLLAATPGTGGVITLLNPIILCNPAALYSCVLSCSRVLRPALALLLFPVCFCWLLCVLLLLLLLFFFLSSSDPLFFVPILLSL